MRRLAGSLLVLLLCVSCAANRDEKRSIPAPTADPSYYVDPSYVGRPPRQSVVVFAKGMGLVARQTAENLLVAKLKDRGVTALRGIDLSPPTRQSTVSELAIVREITDGKFETVLVLSLTTSQRNERLGGSLLRRLRAVYTATLVDVPSGDTIWTAEIRAASSRIFPAPSDRRLAAHAAKVTFKKLLAAGLF